MGVVKSGFECGECGEYVLTLDRNLCLSSTQRTQFK